MIIRQHINSVRHNRINRQWYHLLNASSVNVIDSVQFGILEAVLTSLKITAFWLAIIKLPCITYQLSMLFLFHDKYITKYQ